MSTTVAVNSMALQLLQQTPVLSPVPAKTLPSGDVLLSAANGVAISGASNPQMQAKTKITESYFDNGVDLQGLKLHLFRQLGDELGVAMDDFKDPSAYAAALRHAVATIRLKSEDGGVSFFADIEKKLGLDKLGIGIDNLINAIDDPDGQAAKKLDQALRQATGEDVKNAAGVIQTDENGLYSTAPYSL